MNGSRMSALSVLSALIMTVAGALSFSGAAHATEARAVTSGSDLVHFMEGLEGHWSGDGVQSRLQPDGSRIETGFRLDVDTDYKRENNWQVKNQKHLNNGVIEFGTFYFGVRGDLLYIGLYSPTEPVGLLESAPAALTYQLQRVDPQTGRVYVFQYHLEQVVTPEGKKLLGHNTVSVNGVVIQDDSFSLIGG